MIILDWVGIFSIQGAYMHTPGQCRNQATISNLNMSSANVVYYTGVYIVPPNLKKIDLNVKGFSSILFAFHSTLWPSFELSLPLAEFNLISNRTD